MDTIRGAFTLSLVSIFAHDRTGSSMTSIYCASDGIPKMLTLWLNCKCPPPYVPLLCLFTRSGGRLIDFFRYYSRDFAYNTGVASIRAGLLKKESKGWQNEVRDS